MDLPLRAGAIARASFGRIFSFLPPKDWVVEGIAVCGLHLYPCIEFLEDCCVFQPPEKPKELYQNCSEKSRIIFVSSCKGDHTDSAVRSMVAAGNSDHTEIRVEDVFSVSPAGNPVVYD